MRIRPTRTKRKTIRNEAGIRFHKEDRRYRRDELTEKFVRPLTVLGLRGLDELERAVLVCVGRMLGRSPVVRILEANAANG